MEDHEFPLINISILIHTGDYLDPAGKTAWRADRPADALRRNQNQIARRLRRGGRVPGGANPLRRRRFRREGSLNCLSKDIDAGLALFIDMLRNPGFDEDRLNLAKSQMLQALERRNDSTASIEQREFQRLLRGDKHFTTRPITKASLEAISRQDLIEFPRSLLLPLQLRARGFRRLRH